MWNEDFWVGAFYQSGCTDLAQKDCPDHGKGVFFLLPILTLGDFYGMGTKVLQIVKKASVRCHTISK